MAKTHKTNIDIRLTATDKASKEIDDITSSYEDLVDEIKTVADNNKDINNEGIEDLAKSADKSTKSVTKLSSAFKGFAGNVGNKLKGAFKGVASGIASIVGNFGNIWTVGNDIVTLFNSINASQNKIKTSLNLTNDEAHQMRNIVSDVWTEGFGDVEGVTNNLISLQKNIKGLSKSDLSYLTSSTTVLSDVFEADTERLTGATGALMNEFGISAKDTMDFIAAGFTKGLDSAGDFLDTVNEYSNIFDDAGFSASQFFATLEAGKKTGVLGTDKVADTVKEGYLRFMGGSDTYADALVEARLESEKGSRAYYNLGKSLNEATREMELAEAKSSEWEERLVSAKDKASELKSKLDEAQRTLKEMARPNLKGAEAYDKKLFDLDMRAKELKLAMLDIPKDSPAYEKLEKQLEGVNNQIEKVSLQRDLDLEPKFRALEKSVEDVEVNPEISFSEAQNNINQQKKVVHQLSGQYQEAAKDVKEASGQVEKWSEKHGKSAEEVEHLKEKLVTLRKPVFDMIEDVRSGEKTYAEVLPKIIKWIEGVEDPVTRAAIATEVFGTPIEDLGVDAGLAAIKTGLLSTSMEDLSGTMAETKDNATTPVTKMISVWRKFLLFTQDLINTLLKDILQPFGVKVAGLFTNLFDGIEKANVQGIVDNIKKSIDPVLDAILKFIPTIVKGIKKLISMAKEGLKYIGKQLPKVGDWLLNLKPFIDELITFIGNSASDIFNWLKKLTPYIDRFIKFIGKSVINIFNWLKELLPYFQKFFNLARENVLLVIKNLDGLGPALNNLFGKLKSYIPFILDALYNLMPYVQQGISAISRQIPKIIDWIAELLPSIKVGSKAIADATNEFGLLDRVLNATSAVINILINTWQILVQVGDAILNIFGFVIAVIANLRAVLSGTISPTEAFKNLGIQLGRIFDNVLEIFGLAATSLDDFLSGLGINNEVIASFGETLRNIDVSAFIEGINSAKGSMSGLKGAMDTVGSEEFKNALNSTSNALDKTSKFVTKVSGKFNNEGSTSVSNLTRGFNVLKGILNVVGNVFKMIWQVIDLVANIITVVISIIANLIAVFNGSISPMEAAKNVLNSIVAVFANLGNMVGLAIDSVWGLVDALGGVSPPEWLSNLGGVAANKLGFEGFAEGGNFTGNKPMVVGEEGPEVIMPKRGGTVIPTPSLAGMGGNTVNITIQGSADQATVTQIERAINRSLNNMVKKKVF
jgi:phage-related minor tail protein